MDNVFTETDSEKIDALLYTAIFNEVDRLKNCNNKKERQEIRNFILTSYRALRTAQQVSVNLKNVQENSLQKS